MMTTMQNARTIMPFLALAALASPALASTPEECYLQLRGALERQLALLEPIVDAAGAEAAMPELKAVLQELESMDRSEEAQGALWEYIDNTEGKKMPLLELLQCLAMEFTRLQKAEFFGHDGLGRLLAPQLNPPSGAEFSSPNAH